VIDTISRDCSHITLRIRTDDGSSLDLSSIRLTDSENVGLLINRLEGWESLQNATAVTVQITAIDWSRSGHGVIELRDWSARAAQRFEVGIGGAPLLEIDPEVFMIEEGVSGSERVVILKSSDGRAIDLHSVSLKYGNRGFTILRTDPEVRSYSSSVFVSLPSGDSLRVWIAYTPVGFVTSIDSLRVDFRCGEFTLQVAANPVMPCLEISDLDFGRVQLNETVTRSLEICNRGPGIVRFDSGAQPAVWDLPSSFSISSSDLDRLRSTELDNGDCIAIGVTFTSRELIGEFESVAHFLADPTGCKDSSTWVARVGLTSVEVGADLDGYHLGTISPNPTGGEFSLSYEIATGGKTTITLIDPSGRELRNLLEKEQQAGSHHTLLDLEGLPSGLYLLRIRSEEWDVLRVIHLVR
jgi:hypothetical protein